MKYILIVNEDGSRNEWDNLQSYMQVGTLFKAGAVVMILEQVDLKEGFMKFRPADERDQRIIDHYKANIINSIQTEASDKSPKYQSEVDEIEIQQSIRDAKEK
jgi:hypothetical protein